MKLIFVTDEHHPYADQAARSVALQLVRDFAPDVMTAGSDAMDFYTISRFDHDPARVKAGGLQEEINVWKASQLEWKSAAPRADFFYIQGNHEDRLRKFVWRHPELAGIDALRLPVLLGLPALGIQSGDYQAPGINYRSMLELEVEETLLIRHGSVVTQNSGYTARAELAREFYSRTVLTGHTHRGGTHFATSRNGIVRAVECFCLCDMHPEYIEGNPNWQQGIVLVTVQDGIVDVEAVPIHTIRGRKAAIWRGQTYHEE